MTMCVWCIPKNRQKSLLNLEQNLEKKQQKGRIYQFATNLLSKSYQKVIKRISIGYQKQEFTTENISICNQSTNNLLSN